MHATCMEFVKRQLDHYRQSNVATATNTLRETIWQGETILVELGAQDVNGSIRELLPPKGVHYIGVDIVPGPGVDIVADARTVTVEDIGTDADIVVCTNVLEHVEDWERIIENAWELLATGGWFICQAAGRGFQVHSGRSESLTLEPGEYYGNVDEHDLDAVMTATGFRTIQTWWRDQWPHDVYSVGVK